MDVMELKGLSTLKITLDLGLVDGKTKTKVKSFASVRAAATGADVYEVADAIMALQQHSVINTVKQDNTSLMA
jgi:hypothetical protein